MKSQGNCSSFHRENMGASTSSLLVVLLCLASSIWADAADILRKNESIDDGSRRSTLISAGRVFELGFFDLGDPGRRYVGIWYHGVSPRTTVWVANRQVPIPGSRGSFVLDETGRLVVMNLPKKSILWSSNTNSSSNDTTVQLMDTGNLILRRSSDASSTPLWQSFDHPGDTYLPGMQVGLDLRTNTNTLFYSWKSPNDPSEGEYSMGLDPRRSTQLMIWRNSTPHWRTGPWNGQKFIGTQNMTPQFLFGFKFSNVAAEQKMYYWYTTYGQYKERFVTTPNGTLEMWRWLEEENKWLHIYSDPANACSAYNHCGDYAFCESDHNSCVCLQGFDWVNGNRCARRTPLQCERQIENDNELPDEFLKLERMKVPDDAIWVANVHDVPRCRDACLSNCSCEAFAYVPEGIGCITWGRPLVDLQQFPSEGEDLYIRLAGSEFAASDEKRKLVTVLAPVGSFAFAACLFALLGMIYWRRRMRRRRETISGRRTDLGDLPTFSYQMLAMATGNFSGSNLVGEGGFGSVHKGVLPGGKLIAVKRLSGGSSQGMGELENEVRLIAKLQHRNLVRLLGCSVEQEEKMLVYEYMPNRSLDLYLFGEKRNRGDLDWRTRMKIIGGIARGLVYLHRDSRLTIIHRDLKASNILLDEEMNAKISDFGMARIFTDDGSAEKTKRVVGTYGYMSPEYAMEGQFSVKSDVYSFGVLVLEIVSGKKNQVFTNVQQASTTLLGLAWERWNEKRGMEFVEACVREGCEAGEAVKCLQIGLLCVQDRPQDRPTMPSVVVMLESEDVLLPVPKQPTFTVSRSSGTTADSSEANFFTLSAIVGR